MVATGSSGAIVVTLEALQWRGPVASWGTFDPLDLLMGLAAVVLVGVSLHFGTDARHWSGGRSRLVFVVGLALLTSTATNHSTGSSNERVELVFEVVGVTTIDGDSVEIAGVAAVEGLLDIQELGFSGRVVAVNDVVPREFTSETEILQLVELSCMGADGDRSAPASVSECCPVDTVTGACSIIATRRDQQVMSATISVGAVAVEQPAGSELREFYRGGETAHVTFGEPTPTVPSVTVPPSVEACANFAAQTSSFSLGALTDELLLNSYPSGSHTFSEGAFTLSAEGQGSLLIGLRLTGFIHDPCEEGRVEELSIRIGALGRPGDRGNIAVRPALFVGEDVLISAPLTIASGEGFDESIVLTPADFASLGGDGVQLNSGPPIRFGLVVGISCPATSTCGEVERGGVITALEIIINPV